MILQYIPLEASPAPAPSLEASPASPSVAGAVVEAGLDALDAVDLIRQRRRGAINRLQLKYLQEYKPTRNHGGGGCLVM